MAETAPASEELTGGTPPQRKPVSPEKRRVAALLAHLTTKDPEEQRERLLRYSKYWNVGFLEAYLGYLGQLRMEKPQAAARLAVAVGGDAVRRLEGWSRDKLRIHVKSLGVFASACDHEDNLTMGREAIRRALSLLRVVGDATPERDTLARAALLSRRAGQQRLALGLTARSLQRMIAVRRWDLVPKSLVDHAGSLMWLHEEARAAACFRIALRLLPLHERDYRQAAYVGLAWASQRSKEFLEARRMLSSAVALARPRDVVNGFVLLVRRGDAESGLGALIAAEARYREAHVLHKALDGPYSEVWITLRLATNLLQQRKPAAACRELLCLSARISAIERQKVHQRHIQLLADILASAHAGRISLTQLTTLQNEMFGDWE